MRGVVAVYFDAAAVITVLALLGQALSRALDKRPEAPCGPCSIWSPNTARRVSASGEDEETMGVKTVSVILLKDMTFGIIAGGLLSVVLALSRRRPLSSAHSNQT